MHKINIFWFRRDLRIDDNHGLYKALLKGNVLPLFIFDTYITDKLTKKDKRISFIYFEILKLKKKLESVGSTINVYNDKPLAVFRKLSSEYNMQSVFYNCDYEPYSLRRDQQVEKFLKPKGIVVQSFKDQIIFEKDDVLKKDSNPYTIFTPYSNKWKEKFVQTEIPEFPGEKLLHNFIKMQPSEIIELKELGFSPVKFKIPDRKIDKAIISQYDKTRDIPSINGTSRLSLHLRFGTISIRKLVKVAYKLNKTFLNELIWREFYMMILWHFPRIVDHSFKENYDRLEWRNNEQEFELWCAGQTGYPIVDAGMRQLNETGFMHNRLRMITASFLTKHLLINWRWGEAYFAQQLLDYELASNNGGWQWAASTGCDAAPYFRIFNPELQTQKFDPEFNYIKKWVPELETKEYPKPIVEHKFARERAINTYKKAVK